MKFKLVSVRDEKKIRRYTLSSKWEKSVILPYYKDVYVCFASNSNCSFENLYSKFIYGNDDEAIGALSIIAEKYASNLLEFLSENKGKMQREKVYFLLDKVIPDYLPLTVPRNLIFKYQFGAEYLDDIWVKIFIQVKNIIVFEASVERV